MGLILIYSWANGIKVKLLLCLACGYKIQDWICLWTLISEDLLIYLFLLPVHFPPSPPPPKKINPMDFHFLLNVENDLAYFDGLWNNSTCCLALILHPGAVSHYGYERQNIESLTVRNLCCEEWSLSRATLLVIITLLYLHCSRTLIPSQSRSYIH